jgi:hypothetical protein
MATPGQAVPGTVVTAGATTTTGGPQGALGVTGTRGATWWNGTGPPGTITGSLPGDYYLDTLTGDVYVL